MKIINYPIYFPEKDEEIEKLLEDKKLQKKTFVLKGKPHIFFTPLISEGSIVRNYIHNKYKDVYSKNFYTFTINDLSIRALTSHMSKLEFMPQIIVDIRNTEKSIDTLSNPNALGRTLRKWNINFIQIPALGIKKQRDEAISDAVKALEIYNAVLFIGNKDKGLNIILEHFKNIYQEPKEE